MEIYKFISGSSIVSVIWTFLSTAVPIVVSWATYVATKTQRDIEANQYKLDLYDRRKNASDTLLAWIKEYGSTEEITPDIIRALNASLKSVSVFFSESQTEIKLKLDELGVLYAKKSDTFFRIRNSKELNTDHLYNEYIKENTDAICCFDELSDMIIDYHALLEESLKVPLQPY